MTNLQQFSNIYETFLQLCSVPSPVGKDQKVSVLLQVFLQIGLSAVCCGHVFNNWKVEYGRECKFIFFVYSVLTSPKNASDFFMYIFLMREI